MSISSPCIKCDFLSDDYNGLFTCNGCQKNFCTNHIVDHTNELRNSFEQMINEYNLVNNQFQEFKQRSNDRNWRESHEFGKELREIKLRIDQKQKSSNYSEKDFQQWMVQLNRLRDHILNAGERIPFFEQLSILWTKIIRFLKSPFFLSCLIASVLLIVGYYISLSSHNFIPYSSFTFEHLSGPISILKGDKLAEHTGPDDVSGAFRVDSIFSQGAHKIRISFEQLSPSNAFIGIFHSSDQEVDLTLSPGWWVGDKEVISNIPGESPIFRWIKNIYNFIVKNQPRRLFDRAIKSADVLEIELDCSNSSITLGNQRTKKNYRISIDRDQTPLPWQILFHLDHHGDRLRLL